jgi:hypothetical protein
VVPPGQADRHDPVGLFVAGRCLLAEQGPRGDLQHPLCRCGRVDDGGWAFETVLDAFVVHSDLVLE